MVTAEDRIMTGLLELTHVIGKKASNKVTGQFQTLKKLAEVFKPGYLYPIESPDNEQPPRVQPKEQSPRLQPIEAAPRVQQHTQSQNPLQKSNPVETIASRLLAACRRCRN